MKPNTIINNAIVGAALSIGVSPETLHKYLHQMREEDRKNYETNTAKKDKKATDSKQEEA